MKREEIEAMLKESGIADDKIKDAVDKIMAENGKDIEKHKTEAETAKTTLTQTKTQLDEANKQIEAFKGMNVDDIKKTAEEYKTKFEEADKAHKAELDKIAYNSAAEKFVDGLKPKDGLSKKAILAEFAAKEFKLEGENFIGSKEWAETFKKDNAAHFDDGKSAPGIFSGKTTETNLNMDAFSAAARKAAGLGEAKKE